MARQPTGRPRGRPAYVNWEQWLDGKEHTLTHMVDYTCEPFSMQVQLQRKIREINLTREPEHKLRLRTTRVGGTIRVIPKKRPKAQKYPWDLWLDGEKHTLIRGLGFNVSHNELLAQARRVADARGLELKSATREVDGYRVVVWRAVDPAADLA